MKYISKIILLGFLNSLFLILTGCQHDDIIQETGINTSTVYFKAVNNSAYGNEKLAAESGMVIVTVNHTFTINVNGESKTITKKTKSDELPVMAGNEVEIEFKPRCPEETEAIFSFPDGTTQKVTSSSPSFKWIVPENFKSGMEIQAESTYKTDGKVHWAQGKITLVSI